MAELVAQEEITYQNGPDQIIPSDSYTVSDRNGFVKLWTDLEGIPDSNRRPISIPTMIKEAAQRGGNHPALAIKRDNEWVKWSFEDYYRDARIVGKAFIALGLEPRYSVNILGFNTPEWFLSDIGAVFGGGIAAGIYPTNSMEATKYIAEDSRANIIVVENEKYLDKILPIRDQLPHLKAIVQYTGKPSVEGVIGWQDLMKLGASQTDDELERRLQNMAINECCHLVYTSGTTGPPKAVMLSHDNISFTAAMIVKVFKLTEKYERYVSYLPLSHVAANVCDIYVMMQSLSTVYFADKDALKGTLVDTLKEALPTVFLGVPRVWEKMQEKMMQVGKSNKGIKKQIGEWAKKTGLKHNQKVFEGIDPPLTLSYRVADKLAFQKVREALGLNKCHGCFAAAAPLSKETIEYFMSLNIRIYDIYGMSECSGPQLTNSEDCKRLGSVGKSLPGFSTIIKYDNVNEINEAEGGEICMRGRNVMMGYMDNEIQTNEAIDKEGWLHSGDLGTKDNKDFVYITGRFKEIIITAGGENIPPILIEERIKKELPCLSNVMLIGDKRKFLSCLMTFKVDIDEETMEPSTNLNEEAIEFCQSVGSTATTVQDILNGDGAVMKAIKEAMDKVNMDAISNPQKVQKWHILLKDFSIPGGELGPTLKLKRHFVLKKYQDKIDAFYA